MSVTVEIDGVGEVEFDDTFNDLTKSQQQRLVNRIAAERKNLDQKKKGADSDDGFAANLLRTGVGQGLALGFGDELEAAARTGFGLLGDYKGTRDDIRAQVKDFAKENPNTALAAELAGGLLTGVAGGARVAGTALGRKVLKKAGTTGLAAGIGAGEGAIAGIGSGETAGGRAAGGILGAGIGGTLGAAAPAAISAVKAGVGRVRSGVSNKAAQEAADLKALQSIEEGGMSPEDVLRGLDETRASGVTDAMIPDIAGDATRGLARGASTVSGEGRVIAQKALDERAANMGDEIANDVGNVLGGGKTAREAEEEIITRQKANAASDYDKAFNTPAETMELDTGQIVTFDAAPRRADTSEIEGFFDMPEFDNALKQASKLAALKEQTIPSLAQMKSARKGSRLRFVDADNGALEFTNQSGKKFVAKTPDEAADLIKRFGMQSTSAAGESDTVSTLSTFNFAKEGGFSTNDGARNMLDEALRIVGDDLPPSTLTVEQLHFIKMGLDEAIDIGKRQGSIGRQLQGGLIQKKSEFIDIIDAASDGNYKPANAKFAGEMALREAIELGESFARETPDSLQTLVKKMSDSEKEAFRIGVAQSVRNSVDSTADLADAGKKIFGNEKKRQLLRAAFPDDKTFEAFEKRMKARIEQVITRGYAPRSGSPTALRDQDVSNLSETADAVTSMLMGNPLPAARSALGRVTDRASTSGRVGRALSQDLFSTDPAAQREFLERLARRRAAEQARIARVGRLAGGYGGTAGVFGGLLTGER